MSKDAGLKYSNRVLVEDEATARRVGPEAITRAQLKAATDLQDCLVVNSCFASATLDDDVFPAGMAEVTFFRCNLDNVVVPPKNTVIGLPEDPTRESEPDGCTMKRIGVGLDGMDWVLDEDGNPVRRVIPE